MHTPVQQTREERIWEEGVARELPTISATPETDAAEEREQAERR
jgi:hypothetical protein